MALVTTLEEYNAILKLMPTQNKKDYEILDSSQIIGLDNVWLKMVKDAQEANNTGSSEYCDDEDETGSNLSWSSC
tara:strand:+ start:484 stop:708 length:225 start_codon:yes stop_codon:yes gene_type:complete